MNQPVVVTAEMVEAALKAFGDSSTAELQRQYASPTDVSWARVSMRAALETAWGIEQTTAAHMHERTGYMCSIAYEDELGHTQVEVCHTVEALQKSMGCSQPGVPLGCGIFEVGVRVKSIVQARPMWNIPESEHHVQGGDSVPGRVPQLGEAPIDGSRHP